MGSKTSTFLQAASAGDSSIVAKLLQNGVDPSVMGKLGLCGRPSNEPAIVLAATQGHYNVVSVIVEHVSPPPDFVPCCIEVAREIVTVRGSVAEAATRGHEGTVVALVLSRADCSKPLASSDITPIANCVRKGWVGAVTELLKAKADPCALIPDENGLKETCVARACKQGQDEIVTLLLSAEADPHTKCSYVTESLSLLACAADHGLTASVSMLLCLSDAKAPVRVALDEALGHAVLKKRCGMVLALLEAGASPRAVMPRETSQSVLHGAVTSGCSEIGLQLLRAKADPNEVDSVGTPVLHRAVGMVDEELVAAMLVAGADATLCGEYGQTAVIAATSSYYWPETRAVHSDRSENAAARLRIVQSLLMAKASVNVGTTWKEGPLAFGIRNRTLDETSAMELVKGLLELRADPLAETEHFTSTAKLAYRQGYYRIHDVLVQRGSRPAPEMTQTESEFATAAELRQMLQACPFVLDANDNLTRIWPS
eukprot:TRINITY_DN75829_c0_g1_i1.p1 TRINITY_DN75829_c0_g1~~TRINITY_DN75829_c0_g1_i1.p1  ORF type:complete len:485 (+),score=57.66 TRINITY_DN75829_c0_g1_i1:88-1542(+)